MSVAGQALEQARLEAEGSPDDKARLRAWDRLYSLLGTLESKTSVLLRVNAIVVAALAYVTVVSGTEPFAGASKTLLVVGTWISHVSLVASAASCGFAFPVINVEWSFFGGRIHRVAGGALAFDDDALQRLGRLVERRTFLYAWAWRLAVLGGTGFALLVALATFH